MKGRSDPYMNGQLLSRPRRALPARRRTVPVLAVATTMMASVTLGAQAGAAAEARPAAAGMSRLLRRCQISPA